MPFFFRDTTSTSVKCLWIWFSVKCNSCVWAMRESCLSVPLIFIVSSLLSLHAGVQAAAGGICLCLLPLSSCYGASLPLQNLAILCLVTLSFSSLSAFTVSMNEKRQDFSVCSSLTDKPILFSHSHQSPLLCLSTAQWQSDYVFLWRTSISTQWWITLKFVWLHSRVGALNT